MRVVLAFDKFKGTFSSLEVCELVSEGIRERNPKIEVIQRPMADGGEGSAAILSAALGLEAMRVEIHDLLGKKVEANVYWQNARRLAIIESADVLGVSRTLINEENLFHSSSAGVGQLLQKAFHLRPQEIWLCVGGTLTADLGWGLADVFGLHALDAKGHRLAPLINNMEKIHSFEIQEQPDYIKKCKISVLCDVNAPAKGNGVSLFSFLQQKGAKETSLPRIEKNMQHFWSMLKERLPQLPNLEEPFTGAGGGLCIGISAIFPNHKFELGSRRIAKACAAVASFTGADYVVCGEGCLDELTLHGKTISTVSQLALKEHTKLLGIFGKVRGNEGDLKSKLGLSEIYTILDNSTESHLSSADLIKMSRNKLYEFGQQIADKFGKKR